MSGALLTSTRTNDPLVGETLDDRYEVARRVARGGMATVYEARDLRLSRTVAVKVMHDGLDDDTDFSGRFDSEARAAALLSHPNVVSVFDQGSDRGRPYIVLEYVPGCTLRQVITREAPLEPRRALDLLEPVASALAAAHAAGLVHRDVKPENILISTRGQIKVADFGLARAIAESVSADEGELVIGTVSYIAPELVTRGHADARSDVYSLGIVLYELLTGKKPHRGETPLDVAYRHVHHDVPTPSASSSAGFTGGRIPDYLDSLVTTATSRTRSRRPENAAVFASHLRRARAALEAGGRDDPRLARSVASPQEVDDPVRRRTPALAGATAARGGRSAAGLTVARTFEHLTDEGPHYSGGGSYLVDGGTPHSGLGTSGSGGGTSGSGGGTSGSGGGTSGSGETYRSGGGPSPASPLSPLTRGLPSLPRPSQWQHTPVHRRRRALVLLATVLLVASLLLGGWYAAIGRPAAIPAVAGFGQADAVAAARASGLGVDVRREPSETVPAGQVTRTVPGEDSRVEPGGTVQIFLSTGPERLEVPRLVGLSSAAASRALGDRGLATGAVSDRHHDRVPAGQVISQGTRAGTPVPRGAPVDLVVSLGPEAVSVPDVTGRPFSEAKAALRGLGLRVQIAEEYSATVRRGAIMTQNPAAGQAHRGDTVRLVASRGLPPS